VFTPRAGTEVLVDFLGGDIDRPIVIGQLHNGAHDLPWPAGIDSGANHPGTLSGWHNQHLDGQGANQWLIDDTGGQLRLRLLNYSTSTGHSELTLGHIIQQSARGGAGNAQRGQWLGEGFYGHTDGWAVIRAGEGLLMSTTARAAQGSSVQSTQMDAQEAVGHLKASRQLGDALSLSARQQGALGLASHDAGQAMQQHADAMDPTAQGLYTSHVNGQDARKAQAGSRTLADPVEKFAKPLLHLDTPASAVWVTPASMSLFSGQDTSLSMQGDAHLSSAHTLSSVSGQTTSLYTHAGGIKAITANADLSLRAHTDAMQVWADKDVVVQSVGDEVRIQAQDSITLTAGQSQILIKGGDITFTCPGTFTVKGAGHAWEGPGNQATTMFELPEGLAHVSSTADSLISAQPERYSQRVLVIDPVTGETQSSKYVLLKDMQVMERGRTDGQGLSARYVQEAEGGLDVLIGASSPWVVEYHGGLDRLPLAYDDDDFLSNSQGMQEP
jgi:type VI secretion system secreted protein VgrG